MVNSIQDDIQQYQKQEDLGKTARILQDLPQFKKVISTNLFEHEVTNLVSKLAFLNPKSEEYLDIIRELDAISYLQKYLQNLIEEGTDASMRIKEAQQTLIDDED